MLSKAILARLEQDKATLEFLNLVKGGMGTLKETAINPEFSYQYFLTYVCGNAKSEDKLAEQFHDVVTFLSFMAFRPAFNLFEMGIHSNEMQTRIFAGKVFDLLKGGVSLESIKAICAPLPQTRAFHSAFERKNLFVFKLLTSDVPPKAINNIIAHYPNMAFETDDKYEYGLFKSGVSLEAVIKMTAQRPDHPHILRDFYELCMEDRVHSATRERGKKKIINKINTSPDEVIGMYTKSHRLVTTIWHPMHPGLAEYGSNRLTLKELEQKYGTVKKITPPPIANKPFLAQISQLQGGTDGSVGGFKNALQQKFGQNAWGKW